MNIINLTPHAITIFGGNDTVASVKVPPSGRVARIKTEKVRTHVICSESGQEISVYRTKTIGVPLDLPDPQPNTIYIVSGIFRLYFDRPDLYQPGELVRDPAGNPIGCIGLGR